MKNAIRISVKEPCSEKFENFNKTTLGGFCDSCQKEVIDFTAMTSEELINYFINSTEETCGRFQTSQLKTYEPMIINKPNSSFVSKGLAVMSFSLLSLCAFSNLQAQEVASIDPPAQIESNLLGRTIVMGDIAVEQYTVKGTVVDEDNLPMPGASVVLKGTAEGTTTDIDGRFEFPRALEEGDVLVFNYLGYDTKEYKIPNSDSNVIDITIMFEFADVELMGEVVVGGVYASKRNIFQRFFDLFR